MFKMPKDDFLTVSTVISAVLCIMVALFNLNDFNYPIFFFLGIVVGMIKFAGTAFLINNIIKSVDILKGAFVFLVYFLSWIILIAFVYFITKLEYKAFIYSVLGIVSVTITFLAFNFKKYFYKN